MRAPTRNHLVPALAAATTALVLGSAVLSLGVGAADGPVSLTGATLEWSVSEELNTGAFDGSCNHLSAGPTDGTPTQYRGTDGDVTVQKRNAAGAYVTITDWASRCQDANGAKVTTGGAARLGLRLRLTGGEGTLDRGTGAATVRWSGTFSTNLYDELVPLWFSNLTLDVDGNGSGTLTATLGGFASSIDDPDVREPIPPFPGVVIARFAGLPTSGTTGFVATPLYAGVTYEATEAPQVRNTASWGSWPTGMVDAMVRTGTASYWYSTGSSSDVRKAPAPVTVDFGVTTAPTTTAPTTTAPTTAPPTTAPTTTPPTTVPTTTPPTVPSTTVPTTAPPTVPTTTAVPATIAVPAAAPLVESPPAGVAGSVTARPRTGTAARPTPPDSSPLAASDASSADAASGVVPTPLSVTADPDTSTEPVERKVRRVDASLRYTAMTAAYRPSWNPAAPGRIAVSYTVENTGDVTVAARRRARVSTSLGPDPTRTAVKDMAPLAPGRTRTLTDVVDGVWPGIGAETTVELEPYVPSEPDLDLTAATITARTKSTLLPWRQLAGLALIGAAVAAGLRIRHRRRTATS